jgi:hypothetical protein
MADTSQSTEDEACRVKKFSLSIAKQGKLYVVQACLLNLS